MCASNRPSWGVQSHVRGGRSRRPFRDLPPPVIRGCVGESSEVAGICESLGVTTENTLGLNAMVTETRTKLTGPPATRVESFPGAILPCPLVCNRTETHGEMASRRIRESEKAVHRSASFSAATLPVAFDEYLKQALTSKRGDKAKMLVGRPQMGTSYREYFNHKKGEE